MFRIVFDQAKRDAALEQRGLAFEDAAQVFEGDTIDFEDKRFDYPERRFVCIGFLKGRMVNIIWTPAGRRTRRVISMRKCNAREQKFYAPHFEQ